MLSDISHSKPAREAVNFNDNNNGDKLLLKFGAKFQRLLIILNADMATFFHCLNGVQV